MPRVKICGLTNLADLKLCLEAKVNTVGLVVDYPQPVPWNITLAAAAKIIAEIPPYVSSCLVTGGSSKKVLALAEELKPNIVQLHYRESSEQVKELSQALGSMGIKTIKALLVNAQGQCNFEITEPALATKALAKAGVAAILVDSYTPQQPGGTGIPANLRTFRTIQEHSPVPVILAGGLTPDNVGRIIVKVQPFGIDVLSGVEQSPGKKDPVKVYKFMEAVLKAKIEWVSERLKIKTAEKTELTEIRGDFFGIT